MSGESRNHNSCTSSPDLCRWIPFHVHVSIICLVGEFNEVGRCLLFEMICLARLPVIYKDSFILRSFVFAYASLLKLFDSENNCTFIYILK